MRSASTKALAFFLLVALTMLVLGARVSAYRVSSISMAPGLVPGDVVLCENRPIEINAGDVVVARSPLVGRKILKRVLGTPADTVSTDGFRLTVNGRPIPKRWVREASPDEYGDVYWLQSVGNKTFIAAESFFRQPTIGLVSGTEGYFLVGDNRASSTDSRHFGAVGQDRILCKVALSISEHFTIGVL